MLGEYVAVILDGGPTPGDVPSTIVDCTGDDRAAAARGGVSARDG